MAPNKELAGRQTGPTSTTSLGKRRSRRNRSSESSSPASHQRQPKQPHMGSNSSDTPPADDYGSQSSPMRARPSTSGQINKVAILGAAGGIGQPLAMLLMLHSEYVQHLALYDLAHMQGVVADLSHIDRQCRVTSHEGPSQLADAVRGAKVIIIPAGLAQKPGMTRDDLFGSNAKILSSLAKVCAQVAPEAMLAIITNPVNSLVPIACEVYARHFAAAPPPAAATTTAAPAQATAPAQQSSTNHQQAQQPLQPPTLTSQTQNNSKADLQAAASHQNQETAGHHKSQFMDCCRRIFGVTTLDVVRASTLTAQSALFKPEANGLFRDPSRISVPVVGGHAGKTIIPILSQATPKLDRRRLMEDRATTSTLVESVQEAGIEVLNAKKGRGSATLAMAYAACRFCISLLRAIQGEQNIVECAYVKHQTPPVADLEYFAMPLKLGRDGYTKALGLGKLLPYEQQMVDEAVKILRGNVARGEDFARERL